MEQGYKAGIATAVAAGMAMWSAQASAEAYVGASIGEATLEISDDIDGDILDFDDSDTAYKVFGGYMFNEYFGVEISYLDLGEQSDSFSFDGGEFGIIDAEISAEATGFALQGVGNLPLGPVDLFAKAGFIAYDADLKYTEIIDGVVDYSETEGDSGTDLMYGIGAKFSFGNLAVRAEYEILDIDDVDDLTLLSIGVQMSF